MHIFDHGPHPSQSTTVGGASERARPRRDRIPERLSSVVAGVPLVADEMVSVHADQWSRLENPSHPDFGKKHHYFVQFADDCGSACHVQALETLGLAENALTALPSSIGRLGKLKELYAIKNQLAAVPESIGGLESLEKHRTRDAPNACTTVERDARW